MIVGCRPQEVTDGHFSYKFGPDIERFDGEIVILILISGGREIAISGTEVWFQAHRIQEFLLSSRKVVCLHVCLAQRVMKLGVVGTGRQQRLVNCLSVSRLSCSR